MIHLHKFAIDCDHTVTCNETLAVHSQKISCKYVSRNSAEKNMTS